MKKPWQRQEKRIAQSLGGRPQAGSGSLWHHKGDVLVPHVVRVEAKTSGRVDGQRRRQITIKQEWLDKITAEAGPDELPVLCISFDGQTDWYVIEDYHFQAIIARLKEDGEQG